MRGQTVQFQVALVTETCAACGMVFAMPSNWQQCRLSDHTSFYCPAGHAQHYTSKSDAEVARDEAERYKQLWRESEAYAKHEYDQRRAAERALRATKAAHTRTKNRIKNGVCPCCNRHFENLDRHMHTKHPDYTDA